MWCCGPESNGAKERPVSGNDLPLSRVSVERVIIQKGNMLMHTEEEKLLRK